MENITILELIKRIASYLNLNVDYQPLLRERQEDVRISVSCAVLF
jgi:hypothetical protein